MSFTGISTNKYFSNSLVGEDVSEVIRTLAPYEAPVLDWLGDSDAYAAASPKHEFIEDFLRPRAVIASTAVNSATAATVININGLSEALTVGTILENFSAAPEFLQVTSVWVGGNSITVSRNYDGSGIGSLAVGGSLKVKVPAAPEGDPHNGLHTRRLGNRRANTVGLFKVEIAASNTALGVNLYGGDSYERQRAKVLSELPSLLEAEVLTGVLNSSDSLGANGVTRTMQGLRSQITAVNSQITASSFSANPHLYIGDAMQNAFTNGAAATESWGIVAGLQFFRDISNMNDTKVQDSNEIERFKRVIRTYEGPYGRAEVFFSRALNTTEALLFPRERVRIAPLQNRTFQYIEMGKTGDSLQGILVGEYTVEAYHASAMARIRT